MHAPDELSQGPNRAANRSGLGRSAGSGSESCSWICKGSTPDLDRAPHKSLPLSPRSSRPPTPKPLRCLPALALLDTHCMPIYHPRPQLPNSPHLHPSTPTRPASRSEQLLRETLMRDQMPYTSPPSTRSHHKRRHSEAPTREEELVRGAMMFRSPVVSAHPRSPSPVPSPSLSRRHSHSQRHQQFQPPSHSPSRGQQSPLASRSSIKSQRIRPASPSPTTRSRGHTQPTQSPQSNRRSSITRQRIPHPLPLGPESYYQGGEPVLMTPHEQVLRARLERVLQSGKVIGSAKPYDDWRREDSSPIADDEHDSISDDEEEDEQDENVVRDENGARPWRDRRVPSKLTGGMASPSSSSGSGSARSYSKERQQSSPHHSSAKPSSRAPVARQSHHHRHRHTGTTPPLMSDGSPTPPEDESEDPEDVRLLTPPATPPSHMVAYGYNAPPYGKEYMPSPYYTKATFGPVSPLIVSPTKERRGRTLQGRGRPQPLQQQRSPYAPQEDYDDDASDSGSSCFEDEDQSSCSNGSCSCSGSMCQRRRIPYYPHQQLPTYPTSHLTASQQQQQQRQFNVRRASAKCREMDGYVSFAAVEGLGAPPAECESGEDERRDAMLKKDAKGGVMGGWVRRLWGSEGVVV